MSRVYVRFYAVIDAFNNRVEYAVETEDSLRKRYRQSKDRDTLNSFIESAPCAGNFVTIGPDIIFCRESVDYGTSEAWHGRLQHCVS